MTNKKIWLGMLALVLAFGMTVVGCGDGSGNDNGGNPNGGNPNGDGGDDLGPLDGTWYGNIGNNEGRIIFTGYNWVIQTLSNGNYIDSAKGTFEMDGNNVTLKQTHGKRSPTGPWEPSPATVYGTLSGNNIVINGNTFTKE
jgi:hypothetical protein